uniref:hypothetical protein n=1 Tax=Crenothrix polyspora TaxID=360316 RepID=UPI0015C5E6F7|nr:hypothetical protein [Crenothrix polyspora]
MQTIRVLHDPFQRPAISQKSMAVPETAKTPVQPPVWIPQLKATLLAGRNSMANVNGKVIKLGETINGYKLIKVGERSAIFVKNKQHKQITIDDETNKQNEIN